VAALDSTYDDFLRGIEMRADLDHAALIQSLSFGPGYRFRLVHDGDFYDSKQIVAIGHGVATDEYPTPQTVRGDGPAGQMP
jgi:hypothetical protein